MPAADGPKMIRYVASANTRLQLIASLRGKPRITEVKQKMATKYIVYWSTRAQAERQAPVLDGIGDYEAGGEGEEEETAALTDGNVAGGAEEDVIADDVGEIDEEAFCSSKHFSLDT